LGTDAAFIGCAGIAIVTGIRVVRENTSVKGITGIVCTGISIGTFDGVIETRTIVTAVVGADAVIVTQVIAGTIPFIAEVVFGACISIVTRGDIEGGHTAIDACVRIGDITMVRGTDFPVVAYPHNKFCRAYTIETGVQGTGVIV